MKENKKFVEYVNGPSLAEVNNTVPIPKNTSFWKNIVAFSGPGALVAVGYMDPGNWITSIGGGAQYGYLLLSVVFVSSLIAMLLQYMASKLGIVTGLDLAQATRKHTSRRVGFILWMITELAIMATDIAEVIGGAIALNLLFGLPIIWGVILTVFDVLLLLFLMKLGFRKIEAIVITLILVIMVVFVYEVAISNPVLADMLKGFVPQKEIFNRGQLTMALGIVGATVMPHNLYLHSSIAQTRSYDRKDEDDVARAVRFSTWDSNIQLTVAFIINTLLLVLGAAMSPYSRAKSDAISLVKAKTPVKKVTNFEVTTTTTTTYSLIGQDSKGEALGILLPAKGGEIKVVKLADNKSDLTEKTAALTLYDGQVVWQTKDMVLYAFDTGEKIKG